MCVYIPLIYPYIFSAAVRVGLIDGKFHLNPTAREVQFCYHILCGKYHKVSFFQLDSSSLNLIVATTEDNISKLALGLVSRPFQKGQVWKAWNKFSDVHVHYVLHVCCAVCIISSSNGGGCGS